MSFEKRIWNLYCALQLEMNIIDFACVTPLFLSNNNNILKSLSIIQKKTEQSTKHDPSKIIFNFLDYDLPDYEKSLLIKALKFSLPPKKLNYA